MKATKKPVTIECMKWDGTNFNDVKNFCGDVAIFKDNAETGCSELFIKTLEGDHHASAGDYIIRGVNGELYPCKPDIFEKTYDIEEKCEAVEMFSFSVAISLLKKGKKVCRAGWNGKGQYIELATAISYKNANGLIINCNHDAIGNNAIAFVGTSGVQMGWLASQADMLADDWTEA